VLATNPAGTDLSPRRPIHHVLRWSRRIGIALAGGAVLLVGILMIALPGPAVIVIPLGLGILSLEFEAPRRWLIALRARAAAVVDKVRARTGRRKRTR
jgi:hypothetical protein